MAIVALMAVASFLWPDASGSTVLERANQQARARVTAVRVDSTAKGPVRPWLETVSPRLRWDWQHLVHVQGALDRVTSGKIKRLMLFLPPRHGKSELATVRYPVYRLERVPETKVIIGAYNATLARKFSRKARRIARERLALAEDRTAVEDWETTRGGGIRAVGVGDGVTGQGGDLIVIDDPVKSREEAESETYRERVWEWYTDDLYTRLEPGGSIVLIMTRWHEDDLAGRILASEDADSWEVISLPAYAEKDDPLGRKVGEALCPDRFDEKALADIKRVTIGFDALYQQAPTPKAGEMFDPAWFEVVSAAPTNAVRVRGWDVAATAGDGDFTAGCRMSRTPQGIYYVEHMERGQWGPGDADQTIKNTATLDGRAVHQHGEQEPGASGKRDAAAFIRLLAGFSVTVEPSSGDKVIRARPLASQAQAGNVKIIAGPWVRAFLEELRQFPRGKNDDQVDAASKAFNKLAAMIPRDMNPKHWKKAYAA